MEKVVEGWKEVHNFYFTQNIIKVIKWRRITYSSRRRARNVYKILVGRLLGE
jgi:hypothetical protein